MNKKTRGTGAMRGQTSVDAEEASGTMVLQGVLPVPRLTLREAAYTELRRALVTGHFAPGEAITIAVLARAMNLGVMPVREAVQQLAAQGALELLPNRSVRVPTYTVVELGKIFEARILLECFAAGRAAALITPEQLEQVSTSLRVLEEELRSAPAVDAIKSNFDFHFSIYRASGSQYIVDMIERLWLRIGPLHLSVFKAAVEDRKEYFSAMPLHSKLVRMLKARDSDRASGIVRELLTKSLAWYQRQVSTPGVAPVQAKRRGRAASR